jgi:hypothetical protein
MNWATIGRFLLEHGVPVLVAAGGGLLLGGRRRAVADAADNATDQALAAALHKARDGAATPVPKTDPFNDEPTRPH